MKFFKKYWENFVVVIWFLLVLVFAIFFTSCNNTNHNYKIDDNDSVSLCVIDSVWSKSNPSTLNPEPLHFFRTECGNVHCTNKKIYKIGDTIVYVWRKN